MWSNKNCSFQSPQLLRLHALYHFPSTPAITGSIAVIAVLLLEHKQDTPITDFNILFLSIQQKTTLQLLASLVNANPPS